MHLMHDGSENPRGQQAFDVSVAFTVLAFVSVTLRLYTRWFIVRAPGIEDHFIIVATVSALCLREVESEIDRSPVVLYWLDRLHCIPYVHSNIAQFKG